MTNNYTLTITKSEAESMVDFIECAFIPYIREDTCIDNVMWVADICNIYKRINEIMDWVKEEEPKKEVEKENLSGYGLCEMCKHFDVNANDTPCCVCKHLFHRSDDVDNWEAIKKEETEDDTNTVRDSSRTCDCGSCGSDSECCHASFD